jgi:uncharacterized RDD family membrane protein YckC
MRLTLLLVAWLRFDSFRGIEVRPQRKKRTVLIACPKCGAANDEHAQACYVCDAIYPFEEDAIQLEAPATRTKTPRASRAAARGSAQARSVQAAAAEEPVVAPEPAVAEAAPVADSVPAAAPLAAAESPELVPSADVPESKEEPAEVFGFAPPAVPEPEGAVSEAAPPAELVLASAALSSAADAAVAAPVTEGSSALNPSPRVKTMPRPAHLADPDPVPEWRREVSRRLEDYRARRRRQGRKLAEPEQSALPFESAVPLEPSHPRYRASLRRHSMSAHRDENPEPALTATPAAQQEASAPLPIVLEETIEVPPPIASEPAASSDLSAEPAADRDHSGDADRIEIAVSQPKFDFVLLADDEQQPQTTLVPVGDLRERTRAALLDAFFLLTAFGAFLLLFKLFGGQLSLGKTEGLVLLVSFLLFYAQYFLLFSIFGGTTPGMYFRGLSVVGFDGQRPEPRQLLWRGIGYLVSGATLLLGFLWALWDEDHLTWHDRMSQTYLTTAPSTLWRDFEDNPVPPLISSDSSDSVPHAT